MKSFVCVALLAACALAAPEGKRDKRGYLLGSSYDGHSLDHALGHSLGHTLGHSLDHYSLEHSLDHSLEHYPLEHSLDHSLSYGGGYNSLYEHAHFAPPAKIITVNKVVEVPKVVAVKKLVSVPKVVGVPQVVQVSRVVSPYGHHHAPLHAPLSAGWW